MKRLKKYTSALIISVAVLASLGFAYAVFFPTGSYEKDEAREEFRKGLLLYNDYKYAGAVDLFVRSLSYNPEFLLSRRMLGMALYFSGQEQEALEQWQVFFDMGGYDPMLFVHIQNMRADSSSAQKESKLVFSRVLNSREGYRYEFPSYMGQLPNKNLYLIASGGKNSGSVIFMNNSGTSENIFRRVSGKLQMPIAAAAGNNELWITDYAKDEIQRLTLPSVPLVGFLNNPKPLGSNGSEPLQFLGPAGICRYDNAYYIADSGNNRIQKVSEQGEFVFEFSKVSGGFSLKNPFGLACSSKGDIYVSEPDQGRVSLFDSGGNFSRYIGDDFLQKPRHLNLNEEKNLLSIADEANGIFLLNTKTNARQQIKGYTKDDTFYPFARAYASIFDIFGNFYVVDYGAHHLVQFSPEQMLFSNLDVWIERIDVSSFPVVGIWLSVKDYNGVPVLNLERENFFVSENDSELGNPSADYLKQFDNQDSTVVLLARNKKMKQYRDTYEWLFNFIYGPIRQKDTMKLMSYSQAVREDSPWTNSRLRLNLAYTSYNEKDDYVTDINQNSGEALYAAVTQLLTQKGKRSVIWINDGNLDASYFNKISLERVEQFAKNNHIAVYVLSYENPDYLSYNENKNRLIKFAENTGGKYFSVFHDNLLDLVKDIRQREQERYVLTYRSATSSDWQGRYIDVKVSVDFLRQKGSESGGYFIPAQQNKKGLFSFQ